MRSQVHIGIAGYGFVGNAMDVIINNDAKVVIYDTNKNINSSSELVDTDLIFVCLPTPSNEDGFDGSNLSDLFDFLIDCQYKGIVVVKSTSPYSFLRKYQDVLNLVFNPEFLNQNTYIRDAENQKTVILGGDSQHTKKVRWFYQNFTTLNNPDFELMSMKEACDFKYTRNLYGAYKVLFWEFIQDTTYNSRKMAELLKKFPQPEMSQVGMDGERGYGGACFPKDVEAWDGEFHHLLTKFMLEYNSKLK